MSFRLEKLENGNLKLEIVQDKGEENRDWDNLHDREDDGLWDLLEEGYIGNGWTMVHADQTGDMTDSPMICDDFSVEDDGDFVIYGNVWWFPNYMIENPIETLRDRGKVIFNLAHKAGNLVPPKWRHKFYNSTKNTVIAEPHGMCKLLKYCHEHKANSKVPSCKSRRGRGRKIP